MNKMQELYEKVARDSALQAKFTTVMNDATKAAEEVIGEKLVAFAKEEGFDVTTDEIQNFFKNLTEEQSGELSDTELDMVAGGKGTLSTLTSVISLGFGCSIGSVIGEMASGDCNKFYER